MYKQIRGFRKGAVLGSSTKDRANYMYKSLRSPDDTIGNILWILKLVPNIYTRGEEEAREWKQVFFLCLSASPTLHTHATTAQDIRSHSGSEIMCKNAAKYFFPPYILNSNLFSLLVLSFLHSAECCSRIYQQRVKSHWIKNRRNFNLVCMIAVEWMATGGEKRQHFSAI